MIKSLFQHKETNRFITSCRNEQSAMLGDQRVILFNYLYHNNDLEFDCHDTQAMLSSDFLDQFDYIGDFRC